MVAKRKPSEDSHTAEEFLILLERCLAQVERQTAEFFVGNDLQHKIFLRLCGGNIPSWQYRCDRGHHWTPPSLRAFGPKPGK